MARYQVMFWKHIPAQVKAWDASGEVKLMLPDRFQAARPGSGRAASVSPPRSRPRL